MKKYYLIIILLLFAQCDYKPIYLQNNQNFGIKIIEFNENRSNKILASKLENYSYKKNKTFLFVGTKRQGGFNYFHFACFIVLNVDDINVDER